MAEKPRNGGDWTEARFRSFIVSAIRQASQRWGPKNKAKAKARTRRGCYKCEGCKQEVPATLPAPAGKKRRINNAAVDHIDPVVDPKVGFVDWDTYIKRMFVEVNGYQILCHACHTIKSNKEKAIGKARRSK